ncbi:MAG TPA: TrmH family RNA methyltransferase [Lacipirellulaceae bacterium]|nr:TrmH family RNA methyltransferase [Lacipirellulaceae bacterium]
MASRSRITSRQNPRVRDAAQLRTSRARQRQGRFLIDGVREISRAIASGVRCIEAFVCDEFCVTRECQSVVTAVESTDAEIFSVPSNVYAKLAFGEREDGVVVVAEAPQRRLQDLQLPPTPLVAVLDGIEKPGNLGAILRSADAAGVDAVVAADAGTDLFNPNTIRASLGTVFSANVCEATAADTLAWLRDRGLATLAARPDASKLYTEVDMRGPTAIVLGNEAAGLAPVWNGENITAVRIPMHGLADSLNVSTTAAVLFYEALRQRQS